MTLSPNATDGHEPQSIEPLADLYEGLNVRVYRFDQSRAIVRLGYGSDTAVLVVRPWSWTESEPTHGAYRGAVSSVNAELTHALLSKEPGAVAEMDFASLLLWSCRRGSLGHRAFADDGYQEDAQRVGPRAFNRFLIREALQTWLQMGIGPQEILRIEAIPGTAPALRLSHGNTQAVIAALVEEVDVGDDPLLADWPRRAFGAITAN